MTIDRSEAAAALSDIDDIVQRVRRSRIYRIASLMLMLWGPLTAVGYGVSWAWPGYAGYAWVAIHLVGLAGSFGIAARGRARDGTRSLSGRVLAAFVLFFAFGLLWSIGIVQFTPRQIGAFWPIYFMLVYTVAGLWFGTAFVVDRPRHHRADAGRLLLRRSVVRALDGARQRRRTAARRSLDAAELTMAELDDIIHQPLRLKIMAALNALPAAQGLDFAGLKKLTGATDGNLGAHIETLAKAGYVARRQGLRRQEAADHGDRHRGRSGRVRAARGDAAGDHRGVAMMAGRVAASAAPG